MRRNKAKGIDPCERKGGHPSGIGRRGVGAVRVFEGENEIPTGVIINEGGARPVESRPLAAAGAADDVAAQIEFERQAADPAIGRRDEGNTAPAFRAKSPVACHPSAAFQTLGRKQYI